MIGKSYIWVSFMLFLSLLAGCASDLSDGGGMTFSVSEDKQVVFAPGNLAEDGRSFVEHQWEYGGLFGWGTGDRPADTTDKWEDFVRFVDWGNFVAGGWRTLTADEWHHLLFERPGADEKNAVGSVNGMHGLLLLPDECALPSGILFDCKAIDWNANSYSVDQWEQLEDAGVIFLPAAGYRSKASVVNSVVSGAGASGYYWSSSSPTDNNASAYSVYFDAGTKDSARKYGRDGGFSVRLVREL